MTDLRMAKVYEVLRLAVNFKFSINGMTFHSGLRTSTVLFKKKKTTYVWECIMSTKQKNAHGS